MKLIFLLLFIQVAYSEVVDLQDYFMEAKNQGMRNTCSSFAATALVESLYKLRTGKSLDLSENYTFHQTTKLVKKDSFLSSIYLDSQSGFAGFLALESILDGVMTEQCWPYDSNKIKKNCSIFPLKLSKIFIKKEDIGKWILKYKRPVIFNLLWCSDALNKNGDLSMSSVDQKNDCKGHVIVLTGYDSKLKVFKFRNSWGVDWGRNGYGTVTEQYLLKNCEVCSYLNKHDDYSYFEKEFILKASMGISAEILESDF